MKWTQQLVAQKAEEMGLTPVQIDGIPEGFSFKRPDITIGDKHIIGDYTVFIPLTENIINSQNPEALVNEYNRYGK